MKSQDYQGILEKNVLASVQKLGLSRRSWVLQQHNEPKQTDKNIQERLRAEHWTILKWPSIRKQCLIFILLLLLSVSSHFTDRSVLLSLTEVYQKFHPRL